MNYKYKGLNITYDIKGKGQPIILLHGWGTSKRTFYHLVEEIKNKYAGYRRNQAVDPMRCSNRSQQYP